MYCIYMYMCVCVYICMALWLNKSQKVLKTVSKNLNKYITQQNIK